jgi:hypothetical protein
MKRLDVHAKRMLPAMAFQKMCVRIINSRLNPKKDNATAFRHDEDVARIGNDLRHVNSLNPRRFDTRENLRVVDDRIDFVGVERAPYLRRRAPRNP